MDKDILKEFTEHLRFISKHNARADKDRVKYRLDVWEYSYLSPDYINQNINNFIMMPKRVRGRKLFVPDFSNVSAPASLNWITLGAVTSVRSQVSNKSVFNCVFDNEKFL